MRARNAGVDLTPAFHNSSGGGRRGSRDKKVCENGRREGSSHMERAALARHSALIPSFSKHWLTSYLRPGVGAGHGRPGCVGPSPAPRAVPAVGREGTGADQPSAGGCGWSRSVCPGRLPGRSDS